MLSKDNPTPIYPADGYIYVSSSTGTASWSVNPSSGQYNQSPKLESGKKYYFSITYVYSNGKFTSNTASLTVPNYSQGDSGDAAAFSSPTLAVSTDSTNINFSWTALPGKTVKYNGTVYHNFSYYKVVASATDSTPVYPDNGYLAVFSDTGSSSWSLNPLKNDYNKSPKLEAGKKYYFAITYVFSDGKFVTNTVSATVPAYATPSQTPSQTPFSSPSLSVSSGSGKLVFSWKALPATSVQYNGKSYEGFTYYKVVASKTNPAPVYPDDGYLYYATDLGATTWSVSPASGSYNHSPTLEPGNTYYFAITYVFSNGKFISNTVKYSVPPAAG